MKEDEKKSGERDEELVRRAQSGDKQATEALLVRFAGVVRGRARGFFLIGGETEDLIQEGMIGLYGAISDGREFFQKMSKVLSDFEFRVTVMYMDGLSCAEICEATGKDGKSVDNAIQRSKKKLQKILK